MDSSPIPASSFYFFPRLPPELRLQIWQGAMPYKVVPALIPYKKGGWSLREPIPSDIECFGEEFVDDTLLVLDFDMNVLDKTEVEVPLFFVNKEARTVALAWIQQHYIEMRSLVREKPTTAFFRSFRYHEDALYVSRANFADFVNEAERKVFIETDLMDRHVKTITPLIKRIALPESVFAIHDDEDTRAWMSVFASQHTVSTSSSEKVSVFCESLAENMWVRELVILLNDSSNPTIVSIED